MRLLIGLATAISLAGQTAYFGQWAHSYDKALDAIRKSQWTAAVSHLQQAIAIDPEAAPNKRIDATFSADYFPQFYLFYAHVKLKQYDKASVYAAAAHPPRSIVIDEPEVRAEFERSAAGRQAANKAATDKATADKAADKASAERAAQERADRDRAAAGEVHRRFEAAVKRGEAALGAKQYQQAIAAYNEARATLPDEFNKRGLAAKLDDAIHGAAAQRQVADKEAADKAAAEAAAFRAASEKAAADKVTADRRAADEAAAQRVRGQWAVPYDRAIDLIRKSQWEQAIPLLQQAMALDAAPGANKRVEGVLALDYFPQFYLFYAHVKLKQYDKAQPYVNAARPARPVVTDAPQVFSEYQAAARRER